MEPPTEVQRTVRPILLLTLAKHRDGEWVTNLVKALEVRGRPVTIRDVEALSGTDLPMDQPMPWSAVCNRVSDAAAPELAKATLAALQLARLRGLSVTNGHEAYGIGMSKLLHHAALQRAGLATPRSTVVHEPGPADLLDAADRLVAAPPAHGCAGPVAFPLLLKPNAGGFGAGIHRFDSREELGAHSEPLGSNDGLGLLQEYTAPRDGAFYRVWTLGRKVQCAVQVTGTQGFNTCMAGACVRQARPTVRAWDPPAEVRDAVVGVMTAVGADFGSIELLFDAADGRAVYFDVNMCSTLPNVSTVADPDGLWADPPRDFYDEMAGHILDKEAASAGSVAP